MALINTILFYIIDFLSVILFIKANKYIDLISKIIHSQLVVKYC